MIRKIKTGFILTAMLILAGCFNGGSKGQAVSDMEFEVLHETQSSSISLSGDFSLIYTCKVENESGTLDASELELDLEYEDMTLHMPLFDADTYLEYADGSMYEFSSEDKAKGRKEPGSVYSSNKIPSNGVTLMIHLSRSGDVISGEATYEGGAMGKGNHQFWIYHYYSDVKLPEEIVLNVTGQKVHMTNASYRLE